MTTDHVGFEYCALRYLNMWLSNEREACEALAGDDVQVKLDALAKFAVAYGIARNLPTRHDRGEKLLRFQPVLEIIDEYTADDFQGTSLVENVKLVNSLISKRYERGSVLSLTTKLLWLKVKSPIIIYDQQARAALNTKYGEIEAFYSLWRQQFEKNKSRIEDACESLPDVHKYSIDPGFGSREYVAGISSQAWFQERVFDIYLWHTGANKLSKKKPATAKKQT